MNFKFIIILLSILPMFGYSQTLGTDPVKYMEKGTRIIFKKEYTEKLVIIFYPDSSYKESRTFQNTKELNDKKDKSGPDITTGHWTILNNNLYCYGKDSSIPELIFIIRPNKLVYNKKLMAPIKRLKAEKEKGLIPKIRISSYTIVNKLRKIEK